MIVDPTTLFGLATIVFFSKSLCELYFEMIDYN